ncbi:hypothetical protein CR970_02775 [Candidatus Saccharibacteria bacterium]|nr:MAG: hypothetical protein CR970_02775 [Candidatus Saccharibacteria bacterium]
MPKHNHRAHSRQPAAWSHNIANTWKTLRLGQRIFAVFVALCIAFTSGMYGIALWYQHSLRDQPLRYGMTFIPRYARQLGVDPQQTLDAMIYDLGLRQFRLVSYWNIHEAQQNVYDFSELDWQFEKINRAGGKVSLAIGLRQPRWPECHMPTWAERMTKPQWSAALKTYIRQVVERYKDNPALESYQLENEYFMKVFGDCPDHTRERLVDEFSLVKALDPKHPVIVSRSNNWVGVPLYAPLPDVVGISVYKRVWDTTITKRYFEYPLPPWFYASLGGIGKILTDRDLIIHELQSEAWLPPDGFSMNNPSDIPEQNKSLDAKRLRERLTYARDTGLREIYLWGGEWWYWRKTVAKDPTLWNAARQELRKQ